LLVRRTEQRVHVPIGFLALVATVDLASTLRAPLSSGLAAHDANQGIGGSAHLCFALLGATMSPESLWMYGFCLPDDVLCERALGSSVVVYRKGSSWCHRPMTWSPRHISHLYLILYSHPSSSRRKSRAIFFPYTHISIGPHIMPDHFTDSGCTRARRLHIRGEDKTILISIIENRSHSDIPFFSSSPTG
jgi:hypothetical protein